MKNIFCLICAAFMLQTVNAQWTKLPAFPGDKETIIGGDGTNIYAYDNWDTHISANSGLTKKIFLNGKCYAVEFIGTNLFLGGWDVLKRTNDAGLKFTDIKAGLTNTRVLTLKKKGTTLFVGTDGGGVFSSPNNGDTWTNVSTGFRGQQSSSQQNIYKLELDGTMLYAGTNYGLYSSADDGTNWSFVSKTGWPDGLPMTPSAVKAFAVKGSFIIAAPATYPLNSSVYVSTNGGNDWTKKVTGLPTSTFYPSSLVFVGNTIILGTDIGVFKSTNNGDTWSDISTGLTSYNINSVYSDGKTLFVGAGNGLFSRPVSDVANSIMQTKSNKTSFQVYPNPAKNKISVQFKGGESVGLLQIFDLQGSLVLTKELTNQNTVVDIEKLAAGSYFVKLCTNDAISTQKFSK